MVSSYLIRHSAQKLCLCTRAFQGQRRRAQARALASRLKVYKMATDNDFKLKENPATERERLIIQSLQSSFENLGLSPFSRSIATQFLQRELGAERGPETMRRVVDYLLGIMTDKKTKDETSHIGQRGCPDIVNSLTAHPVWERNLFPWIEHLELLYPAIKQEFLLARETSMSNGLFQPYRSPIDTKISSEKVDEYGRKATSKGDWNVCYLELHGMNFDSNAEAFPTIYEFLKTLSNNYHHSFISALAPNTHIEPHNGPTNKKLRCQLPLIVPSDGQSWLRVGNVTNILEEGKCIIFDDSFEHEAANESSKPRVVLVFDIWHPEFTSKEIWFLNYLMKTRMVTMKRLLKSKVLESKDDTETDSKDLDEENNETFYSVITKTRGAATSVPAGLVWGDSS